jgi:NADPH-dependent 2,4-dienoyl-CoA reductase/sulfur reductase-like enzyme/rhodanese-related sulfurtransferase
MEDNIMSKRILIVGGVAGGMSAAARVRRLDEDAEIIVFEKGYNVSFSNCSLPYHLSGLIPRSEMLVLMDPPSLKISYNIDARVRHEVIGINRNNKEIEVRDLETGTVYRETYDKLILSPGAKVSIPPIKDLDQIPYFTVRNVEDVDSLNKYLIEKQATDVVVIGGGFIGVEAAENLKMRGLNVSLVEFAPQILTTLDFDMVQILHKEMVDHGVKLYVNEAADAFADGHVVLRSGTKLPADAVVLAAGVRPLSDLAEQAGLELTDRKAIKVDANYLTSDADIYAIGDVIEVPYHLTGSTGPLALAGPALKQARAAADHIYGRVTNNTGYIGSSCIKVFDYNAASTGLTENAIQRQKLAIDYDFVYLFMKDAVSLMPNAQDQHLKVLYEVPSGRILGAQCIGKGDVVKRCDVIAAMLKFNPTLEHLKDLELCYAPPFSTARDSVNFAGYIGLNSLQGDYKFVPVSAARELVESNAYIIDVRGPREFAAGHLKNAINLPLSQLRDRMDEVPKDRPVYLYCRSSLRAYNAIRALQNKGWDNIWGLSGSMIGISWYEWFEDQRTGREPIVTKYLFR